MTAQEKDHIECAIRHIQTAVDVDPWAKEIAVDAMRKLLVKDNHDFSQGLVKDTISRQAAKEAYCKKFCHPGVLCPDSGFCREVDEAFDPVPSAQPEPLTDKEQRIFLAAMGREEKICEEVDRNYVREPYEDSLVRVCKEIRRKVKGALWI